MSMASQNRESGSDCLLVYSIVAVLMALIFCSIYGVRVLDPTYTDWLLKGGDL